MAGMDRIPRVIQFSHDLVYMVIKAEKHRKDSSNQLFITHVHGTMPGVIEPGQVLPPYLVGSEVEKQIAEAIRPIVKNLLDGGMNTQVIPSTLANAAFLEMINNGSIRIPLDITVVTIPLRTNRRSNHRS